MTAEGHAHDLQDILDKCLAHPSLANASGVTRIYWFGRRVSKKARKARVFLAWYSCVDRSIRVNRVLDHDWIPEYVLCAIVAHELLHHLLPWRRGEDPHGPEFVRAEASLPWKRLYDWWVAKNLSRLLGN